MSHSFRVAQDWTPSGRYRLRMGWFGRIVVQVHETRRVGTGGLGPDTVWRGSEQRWRTARHRDLDAWSIEFMHPIVDAAHRGLPDDAGEERLR
jgi:hypothetical protein